MIVTKISTNYISSYWLKCFSLKKKKKKIARTQKGELGRHPVFTEPYKIQLWTALEKIMWSVEKVKEQIG